MKDGVPRVRDRMMGAYGKPRCPSCHASAGADCAGAARRTSQRRKLEKAALRRYLNAMEDE